jgi:hypothetical protein
MAERMVRDVVRAVVTDQAEHELPYLAKLEDDDDAWVIWRLRHPRRLGPVVGFGGFAEAMTMVTPVVWIAIDEAAREIGGEAGGGVRVVVRALVRKILRREPNAETAPVPPLTDAQIGKVREKVAAELRNRKIRDSKARDIANAVCEELKK